AVASGSALALSTFGENGGGITANKTGAQQLAAVAPGVSSPYGQNAFVDPGTNTAANISAQIANTSSSDDPNNLTGTLTDAFLNGIISANPNGPQTDASGTATFVAPDQQSIASALGASPSVTNLQIPDWDLDAADYKLDIAQAS